MSALIAEKTNRYRDGNSELLIELPGDAAHKGHRRKHGTENKSDHDDRPRNFLHRSHCRLTWLEAVLNS